MRAQLSLCAALERARHRAQDAGQHEIATLQTTAIDQTAGMVNLTTTLAHASGEWIASDWPVCPIAETANPQRMGAALTYARRYALFTLVGIAGEDDLDAPDLCDGPLLAAERPFKPIDHQARMPTRTPRDGHARGGSTKLERAVILDSEQSAALREKLLTQLGNIILADLAAAWAREALSAPRTASQQPMPSSWRTPLSAGYRRSHHRMRPHPQMMSLQGLRLPARM